MTQQMERRMPNTLIHRSKYDLVSMKRWVWMMLMVPYS